MRIASLAEVKAKLSAFLDEAGQSGPVVITRNGRPAAVLLAPPDADDLEGLLLSRSPRFRALLSKARSGIQAGQGIGHAEFWKKASDRAAQQPVERGGRRGACSNRRRSKSAPTAR